ncbi:hypothetical protein BW723_13845 [Polaribacter reichenbachii]|uniref:DUF3037 domain-containing protein n=1 Tax=Polaribacter reichenbachii TaxID=996801 RepID=A0A1B8U1K2_9FLAO|nr:DUF3037 domain-containing protein [Polaribacter reichenbachii]APZ47299.1 hypothetical protein BW723_13845 [Polaribacter reichenbachii]AUC17940.1 hypothetical protein BTO17_04300 [Polaribacter reichenbachii]OBY65735.1 hypothetical protein LPB301_07935 [Polaribacter reichenbachii]
MQDKVTFEYAIIRIVPKVEREEFFNIGVILFSKRKKFLDIKYHINPNKLKALAPDLEIDFINDYLNAWKLICDGKHAGGKIAEFEISDRFRWLAACRSTIIQSSKTHPGICNDPEKELNAIFEEFVL